MTEKPSVSIHIHVEGAEQAIAAIEAAKRQARSLPSPGLSLLSPARAREYHWSLGKHGIRVWHSDCSVGDEEVRLQWIPDTPPDVPISSVPVDGTLQTLTLWLGRHEEAHRIAARIEESDSEEASDG